MAYPLAQCPTFREFKATLGSQFNCEFKERNVFKNKEPYAVFYFERCVGGNILQCSVDSYDDEEIIMFPVIRSICKRLQVDPSVFGLTLG